MYSCYYLGKSNKNRKLNGNLFLFFLLDDWFLEKIVIEERNYPFTTYTFVHNNWLHQQSKKDFTEASIPLQGQVSSFSNLRYKDRDRCTDVEIQR